MKALHRLHRLRVKRSSLSTSRPSNMIDFTLSHQAFQGALVKRASPERQHHSALFLPIVTLPTCRPSVLSISSSIEIFEEQFEVGRNNVFKLPASNLHRFIASPALPSQPESPRTLANCRISQSHKMNCREKQKVKLKGNSKQISEKQNRSI